MKDLLNRFFGARGAAKSKEDAKQRLKFLLIHDQVDLTPGQIASMKEEIMAVIKKYCEIDPEDLVLELERAEDHVALVSSVPVRRVVNRPVASGA